MEIRDNENFCIIAPITDLVNSYKISKILNKAANDNRNIAIDLKYINECSIEFIEGLKCLCNKKEIGIFNIPSDIFVLFNIMNLDKIAQLFVSEADFEEKTRQLINRKFSII